ncbi:MAG: four-carbon acid sugar kinase family protein [Dysosmobacter sp.]|nr:four-carbon acid sugar kinase family protein [Dysosmobacter sp.]
MIQLLILADDFTGALDTGVQFAARGAVTKVVTDPSYDFAKTEGAVQVLVVAAETRHLPPEEARKRVLRTVRRALDAGVGYIYKKTDSALRGNIGAELSAVLEAAGADSMAFLPALPKMQRTTRGGIHYISGVPVAESVFGQDPFEPIRKSAVREIIAEQSQVPVVLHPRAETSAPWERPGIQVYDAETDEDLRRIASQLGPERLRLSAGCAGFAEALADILGLDGQVPAFPELEPSLFIACGSVNPVTLRQMEMADAAGFPHIHLTPVQKLDPVWLESPECEERVSAWLEEAARAGRFILDVNDPAGRDDTAEYARVHGLTTEDLRVRISEQLAKLTRRLLDGGLNATMLCTGGDTLLALMRAVGVDQLTPVCEAAAGAVLTSFAYQGNLYHIISKSGGFGEPGLLCQLASLVRTGNQKEDALC